MYLKHNSFSTVQHVVLRKVFNFLIAIPTDQWRIWRHSCRQVQPQGGQTPRRVHTTRPKTLTRHSASQGITTITFVLRCPTIKYRNITSNIRPDFAVEKFWNFVFGNFQESASMNLRILIELIVRYIINSRPSKYSLVSPFGRFTSSSQILVHSPNFPKINLK